MKRFRLIGVTAGEEKTALIWAHSDLEAGARWKGDPAFYGIAELQFIEETQRGFKKPYRQSRTAQYQAYKRRMSKAGMRIDFSL